MNAFDGGTVIELSFFGLFTSHQKIIIKYRKSLCAKLTWKIEITREIEIRKFGMYCG